MKKIFGFILCLILYLGTLSACSFYGQTTFNIEEINMLEGVTEDYEILPKSFVKGKENLVDYLTISYDLVNNTDESFEFTFTDFELYDKNDNELDVEIDVREDVSVRANKTKSYEMSFTGKALKDLSYIAFKCCGMDFEISGIPEKFVYEGYGIFELPATPDTPPQPQPVQPSTPPVDIERTAWGNDDYGYLTLSNEFAKYTTTTVSQEVQDNILQWALMDENFENPQIIVTLTAAENDFDSTFNSIVNDGVLDSVILGGKENDKYKIGVGYGYYPDEDCYLEVVLANSSDSKKNYYIAVESYGLSQEEFMNISESIIFSHTIFAQPDALNFFINEFEKIAPANPDTPVDNGTTVTLFDYSNDKLIDINIPSKFTIDAEFTDKYAVCLDSVISQYSSIFINNYIDVYTEEFVETGSISFDATKYKKYEWEVVTDEILKETNNRLLILELDVEDTDDYDYDRYLVSLFTADDSGVSFNVYTDDLEEMGYFSINDLVKDLFF